MTYNLVDEKWIFVRTAAGEVQQLGLKDILLRAPELAEVTESICIVEFGIYRLLSALVLDIYRPKNVFWITSTLKKEGFEPDAITSYFEEWQDRFDLFDPNSPFLQTAGMMDDEPKPLAGLIPIIPSGTNAFHFHRAHETEFSVSPGAAAGLLTTIAPFMTAGGAGLSPSINGSPPLYVLIHGKNLFETIVLNCDLLPRPGADGELGVPAWRSGTPKGADGVTPLLNGLTWQPRKIQLVPQSSGSCSATGAICETTVSRMKFKAGFKGDPHWTDPAVAYKKKEDDRTPIRLQEDRELWRDTGPLVLLNANKYEGKQTSVRYERPRLITQFAGLRPVAAGTTLNITVFGMRTDLKMKVFEWQKETLAVPSDITWKDQLHVAIQKEADLADAVAYAFRRALKEVFPRGGEGNKSANESLFRHHVRQLWRKWQPIYTQLLFDLSGKTTNGGAHSADEDIATWRQAIGALTKLEFDQAVDGYDTDGELIKRQCEAKKHLYFRLNNLLQPESEKAKAAEELTKRKRN